MRMALGAVFGLVGGFFLGMVLDQVIGIIGFLFFDGPVHFRGLPVILAVVGIAAGVFLASRSRTQ
ncbi:DUF5957 family protein [Nocardiopsis kunsanensis]|uniref:DUF5957 family protein n=1 Tax=Nocardiopsis kunsanensis TaxID=141693 RepID=UPI00034C4BAD|nr:DUF5957 family protein [Nocardiopsis kunsanensis]